jgi:uncharacterized protein with GYD domain
VPKYLIQASFTPEGIREVLSKSKGALLESAAGKFIEAAGGKIEAYYFAFGKDDVVSIADLPDNVTAAALSIAANAAGVVSFTTTPLLTVEEMDNAVAKSAKLPVPGVM